MLNLTQMMNDTVWQVAPPREEARALAADLKIPLEIARILVNRKILDGETAREFLFGGLDGLHDPYLMSGMKEAVARIQKAIEDREKILIFGDYDVDGILSVVMLHKAISSLGGQADYFIPERLTDGYGIKEHHVDIPIARGTGLVISVDCGIKAVEFVEKARAGGVDVIITDHHMPGSEIPRAAAVLNPVLEDSGYPDKTLAGVGVVFKLIQALLEKYGKSSVLRHYIKLVCIGTVADVAELKGENRLFVRYGLKGLENVTNTGLRSLIESCGLNNRKISEGDLGFRIGPRINAAGRMGMTDIAVRLFFSESVEETLLLVKQLEELNSRRQATEEKIFREARAEIEKKGLQERYKCLILGSPDWHRGVLGIVASRLKDVFRRPVILFNYEDGLARGSGRSIPECALIELLDACRGYLVNYGGHRLAVGCTLTRENMAGFKQAMNEVSADRISPEDMKRKIRIDTPLELAALDTDFMEHFSRLVPFGVGNPKPVFLTEKADVCSAPQKIQGKHLKFWIRQNGRSFEALAWDKGDWAPFIHRGDKIDLAFSLHVSEYLGEERVNLSVEDVRTSKSS